MKNKKYLTNKEILIANKALKGIVKEIEAGLRGDFQISYSNKLLLKAFAEITYTRRHFSYEKK